MDSELGSQWRVLQGGIHIGAGEVAEAWTLCWAAPSQASETHKPLLAKALILVFPLLGQIPANAILVGWSENKLNSLSVFK